MNEHSHVAAFFGWLIVAISLAPPLLFLASILMAFSPIAGVVVGAIIGAVCIQWFVRSLNRSATRPSNHPAAPPDSR